MPEVLTRSLRWIMTGGLLLGVPLLLIALAVERGLVSLPHPFVTLPGAGSGPSGGETSATLPDGAALVGTGEVDIDGGVIPLAPLVPGQIRQVLVQEGVRVKKNAPLLRMENKLALLVVSGANATVAQAQTRLARARRAVGEHALGLSRQEQAIAIAQAMENAQQAQIDKLARLASERLTSAQDYESARQRGVAARATVRAERLKLDQLRASDPESDARLAASELTLAQEHLATAQEQLAQHVLRAPEDGVVLRLLVSAGQVLGPGQKQPALWFQPDRPLIVRCEVEQQFVDRIRPGMVCDVYEDRLDLPGWKGRVQRCSGWIAPRRSLGDDPLERRDARTLECIIRFESVPSLRIGQRLRVVFRREGGA